MNVEKIFEIASQVSTPLALGGFFAAVVFLIFRQIVAKNIFPRLTASFGADILKLIIERLFILSLVAMILGFIAFIVPKVFPGPIPTVQSSLKANDFAEVIRLRIDDLSKTARNLKTLTDEIKAGKVEQPGPLNRINDLNNGLADLWFKIAGYGLGADPYLENIFVSSSGFLRADLPPDYGIKDVPTSMGIPRLYAKYLELTEKSDKDRDSKYLELSAFVRSYESPAVYPHREFYERAYASYRQGKELDSTRFRDDITSVDAWLVRLSEDLGKVRQIAGGL